MEITCRGDEVIIKVNGQLVNHAANCNVTEGAVSLQSEGTPIEFRKVSLVPLTKWSLSRDVSQRKLARAPWRFRKRARSVLA